MPSPTDEQFLQRALDLAGQGIGLSSPNPCVGALITDAQGNLAGTGVHTYAGLKHAEVLALEAAGDRARGGTVYINLEPCSHQGRTPPCADALIAAGVRRVVASMPDPNPKVSGQGFEKLRAAGVQVEIGGLQEEARCLNENFARYIRSGQPFVTLKSAMTLDGKIAPPPNLSNRNTKEAEGGFTGSWITGETARAHVQQLRHQHDAILVGVGTILADNPLLTDRSKLPRRRPLLRVILDSQLRLPVDSRLVLDAKTRQQNDALVFCSDTEEQEKEDKKEQLEQAGIRIEKVPVQSDGRLDLAAILRRLGELTITSIMIEGGSTVNASALALGIVNKIFLYYAPRIFGATTSIPFLMGPDFARITEPLHLSSARLHRFAEDIAVEGYLHDPYKD
jgi:diaminohydroxyphosphoribosylaminopyrimidine deaminase/5-amino-6-(5-phosphoribosylamino)uracil reductase